MRFLILSAFSLFTCLSLALDAPDDNVPINECKDKVVTETKALEQIPVCLMQSADNLLRHQLPNDATLCHINSIFEDGLKTKKGVDQRQFCIIYVENPADFPDNIQDPTTIFVKQNENQAFHIADIALFQKDEDLQLIYRNKSPKAPLATFKNNATYLQINSPTTVPISIPFDIVVDGKFKYNDTTLTQLLDPFGNTLSGYDPKSFLVKSIPEGNGGVHSVIIEAPDNSTPLPTDAIFRLVAKTSDKPAKEEILSVYLFDGVSVTQAEYLDILLQYALALKVSADEMYLTSTVNCQSHFSTASVCEEYQLIIDEYLSSCAKIKQFFIPPNKEKNKNYNDCDGIPSGNKGGSDGELILNRSQIEDKDLATVDLLQSDIKYRLALLKKGLPFLGGYRSMSVTTPHHELVKLRSLERRMSDAIDRIERLQIRFQDVDFQQQDLEAEMAYISGQINAEQISSEISSYQTNSLVSDSVNYQNRQTLLAVQINNYTSTIDELAQAQESLSKNASALMQSGIAAATGIPINEIEALASGDLKEFAETFVKDEILSTAGNFAKDFAASSEMISSITEDIDNIQDAVKGLEAYKKDFDAVQGALNGDLDKIKELADKYGVAEINTIIGVGKKLEKDITQIANYAENLSIKQAEDFVKKHLNSAMKKELDTIVDKIKPVQAVLEQTYDDLAREADILKKIEQLKKYESEVKRAIEGIPDLNKLSEQYTHEIDTIIRQGIPLENIEYFKRTVKNLLIEHAKTTDDIEALLHFATSLNTDTLLESKLAQDVVRAADKARLSRQQTETIVNDLPSFLTGEISKIQRNNRTLVEIKNGKISIINPANSGRNQTITISAYLRSFFEDAAFSIEQLEQAIATVQSEISNAETAMLRYSLDGPKAAIKNLQDRLPKAQVNRVWNALKGDTRTFGDAIENAGRREVAKVLINQQMAPQVDENIDAQAVVQRAQRQSTLDQSTEQQSTNYAAPGDSGLNPEASMALQAALNAALPGAGIALSLGQTWASMDANADLIEDYFSRLTDTIAEHGHLTRAIHEADEASAIADLERQRALALKRAARSQLSEFQSQLSSNANLKSEIRQLMFLYRPYFFYLAELMRERFNAFDRSLGLWGTGIGHAGFFAEQIMEDPRNARLALDSEIQLFTWLNRAGESTKTSPYYLFNHWQQLITLAENYCSDYGCKPGDGKLGNIATTVPVKLFADLKGPETHADFKTWKDGSPRNNSREYLLSITPEMLLLPDSITNARILDINVIAVDKKGNYLPGSRVDIRHTGFSRITLFDHQTQTFKTVDEQLLPSNMMPPSSDTVFDIRKLRTRYQSQNDITELLALRNFEGYGVLGNYVVNLINSPYIEDVHDFEIQISYIYQQPNNIRTEFDFLSFIAPDDKCEIPPMVDVDVDTGEETDKDDGTGYTCQVNATIEVKTIDYNEENKTYECKESLANIKVTDDKNFNHLSRLAQHNTCIETKDVAAAPTSRANWLDINEIQNRRHCSEEELFTLVRLNKSQREDYTCFGDIKE